MVDTPRPDLVEEVRVRVPLPIVIPVGALVLIGAATFGFSRILLNVPKYVAVALALVMAANVLGACAYVALKPRMTRANWAELFMVVTYPVIIGIVLTQTGIAATSGGEEKGPAAAMSPSPAAATGALTASGLAWNTDSLSEKAGKPFTVTIKNEDTTTHNFSIYKDDSAKDQLFKGQDVSAGATVDEKVDALPKGSYYFQCDFHPSMNGTLTVK